jgi:hypothetical protein
MSTAQAVKPLVDRGFMLPERQQRDALLALLRAEYWEMPGLALTRAQVERLWQLNRDLSTALLSQLECEGFLHRTAKDTYVRSRP